jgi:hypothetical protein
LPTYSLRRVTHLIPHRGRAKGSGYSLLQFYTDGSSEPHECGYGLSDFDEAEAVRLGPSYKYAGVCKASLLAGKFGKATAVGRCHSVSSGRLPRWAQAQQPRWFTDPRFHGPSFTVAGAATRSKLDSVYPESGLRCGADCPQGYYYSQVYPLAQLQGSCTRDGRLARLSVTCWNSEYRPAPALSMLSATVRFMDCPSCGGGCPQRAMAERLRTVLAFAVAEELGSARLDARVKAGLRRCQVRLWLRLWL